MALEIEVGQHYIVKNFINSSPATLMFRRKLLSMGLIPGASLVVKRIAPLGDPILFDVQGYCLSLRRQELMALLQLDEAENA